MRLIAFASIALLASCAAQSRVVDTGGGSYFVSRQAASGFSGMGNLRADALAEAAQTCGGREVQIISERETPPPYLLGNYPRIDITFRCA